MAESKLARKDGARLVKNSGRGFHKGDAVLPPFLLDYKEFTSSYSVSKKAWEKHARDAWEDGERAACLAIVLDGDTRLAVIDWDMFMIMREAYLYLEKTGRLDNILEDKNATS